MLGIMGCASTCPKRTIRTPRHVILPERVYKMLMPILKIGTVAALLISIAACQKQPSAVTAAPGVPILEEAAPVKKSPTPVGKAYDGPFGLTGEIPIAELERMEFKPSESAWGVYFGTPPRPMDGVSSYYVVAAPNAGLCRIRATIDVDLVNATGDQLKAKVDQLAEMMKVKYGKHTSLIDLARTEAYRRNPQYWMLGLKEESVIYAYDWSAGKTSQPLPDGLDNIEISANATSTSNGYAAIQYTYKNFKDCTSEMTKQRAANL